MVDPVRPVPPYPPTPTGHVYDYGDGTLRRVDGRIVEPKVVEPRRPGVRTQLKRFFNVIKGPKKQW